MKAPLAIVALVLPLTIFGCKPGPTPPNTADKPEATKLPRNGPERPGYTVNITYSPKSIAELSRRHETVIVASYFSGQPKPDAPKKLISEIGDINLGTINTEVLPGSTAQIPMVHFDPATLAETDGHDPELLINAYSGRKSSPDNLLDCSIYQGPLAPVEHTTIPIRCQLITEELPKTG